MIPETLLDGKQNQRVHGHAKNLIFSPRAQNELDERSNYEQVG